MAVWSAPGTMADMELLLLSNSKNPGAGFLDHARDVISAMTDRLVFVPFAFDAWEAYTTSVRAALSDLEVVGAHEGGDPARAILDASCLFVGGGNTFRLLDALRRLDLVEAIGERVRSGACAYVGASAGTNVAGPTIRTTNDMPIVDVGSLDSLALVPFQINPHFTDELPAGLMTETRSERIRQFHERSATPVVALFEGAWVEVRDGDRTVGGTAGAKVFERDGVTDLAPGASLDRWWQDPIYDDRRPGL